MSFEDDMIEYGFSDANDYMDYLMDEADRIYQEQKMWDDDIEYDEEWYEEDSDEYLEFICTDVDELFYHLWLRDKQKSFEEQNKEIEIWKKSCIIKLWENDNPRKANLWKLYFRGKQKYSNKYKKCIYTYTTWEEWLSKLEEYEEFKNKSVDSWNELKENTELNYIIKAIKKYYDIVEYEFIDEIQYKTFKTYKKIINWIKDNNNLFYNEILPKYESKIKDEIFDITNAWSEIFKWNESFTVWKLKYPNLWINKKIEWNKINPIFDWKDQNKSIWDKWLEEHPLEWEQFYKSHHDLLWYVYTEIKWQIIQQSKELCPPKDKKQKPAKKNGRRKGSWDLKISWCNDCLDIFTLLDIVDNADPRTKLENKENLSDENIHAILVEQYNEDITNNKTKELFINENCTEFEMNNYFWSNFNSLNDFEVTPKNYADKMLIELWAKKHKKEWNDWKYRYLWNKEKIECIANLSIWDYFDVWRKKYPTKYEGWINKGYKQWIQCKKHIEVWILWLLDGNVLRFNEWAKNNILDWDEAIFNVMCNDIKFAYDSAGYEMEFYKNEHLREYQEMSKGEECYDYTYLTNYQPQKWLFWKKCVIDIIIKNKWEEKYRNLDRNCQQTSKINFKIKELKYLNRLGMNIFREGLAIIEMNNKYGFFNEKGEIVVPIIYDVVKEFQHGYAAVCKKEKDLDKEFCIEYSKEKELWSIIDTKGNVITKLVYENIRQITKSFAVFERDWRCGILELSTGDEIIPPNMDYADMRILDNGMWVVCNDKKRWAVISPKGNIAPFQYSYIFNSNNDLTMVVKNAILSDNNNGYIWGEWGYIDKNGNEVEELKEFDSPYSFEKYWIDCH